MGKISFEEVPDFLMEVGRLLSNKGESEEHFLFGARNNRWFGFVPRIMELLLEFFKHETRESVAYKISF